MRPASSTVGTCSIHKLQVWNFHLASRLTWMNPFRTIVTLSFVNKADDENSWTFVASSLDSKVVVFCIYSVEKDRSIELIDRLNDGCWLSEAM